MDFSENFDVRDVMVGVLRNRKQLDYNIKYKFYHIPEEWVLSSRLPVKYVALCQTPRLFKSEDTGIFIYGKVIGTELVERAEIHQIPTNQKPSKLYYKFHVDEWIPLKRQIAKGSLLPDVCVFTSEYQFFNAEDTAELFLEKKEHWEFYHMCNSIFPEASLLSKGGFALGVKVGKCYAEWRGKHIVIYKSARFKKRIKMRRIDEKRCAEMFKKYN